MITSVIVPTGYEDRVREKERKRRWKEVVIKRKQSKKNKIRESHLSEKRRNNQHFCLPLIA